MNLCSYIGADWVCRVNVDRVLVLDHPLIQTRRGGREESTEVECLLSITPKRRRKRRRRCNVGLVLVLNNPPARSAWGTKGAYAIACQHALQRPEGSGANLIRKQSLRAAHDSAAAAASAASIASTTAKDEEQEVEGDSNRQHSSWKR